MSFSDGIIPILIKSLDDSNQTILESTRGSIFLEFTLKPFRDRLFLHGWTTIKEDISWILDGFQLSYPNKETWRSYKVEAYFPREDKGLLRAVRYEDWFIDQPFQKEISNKKFSEALGSLLPDQKGKKLVSSISKELSDKKVTISPSKGATIRDILFQLSKELKFFWTLHPTYGFIFFTKDERPREFIITDIPFNIARARKTRTGWQISTIEGEFVYPGTLMEYSQLQKEKMMVAQCSIFAKRGAEGTSDYIFLKSDLEYISHDDIKTSMDSEDYTNEADNERDFFVPEVDILIPEEPDKTYLLKGERANVFGKKDFLNPAKIEKETVINVEDLSPWATKDGFGIVFPRADKEHISITIPTSPIKSVRIGDVPSNDLDNKNGKAFNLNMPKGYLYFDTETGHWTIHGEKIMLIENADDPVARKSDLQKLVDIFNDHTHTVNVTTTCGAGAGSGTGTAIKTTTPQTASGSSKVFAK